MKKIIVIPDSFKGSLSSMEVCNAIEEGILKVFKNATIKKFPLQTEAKERWILYYTLRAEKLKKSR